ncbi:hypothetical protein COY23_00935 [bacterium (Candidatus Torokbacteria) CG_4_10_14_0_2_um_filter_35_8]|nr:MAG: hypothetical protein COY23_00935 [bacterium (Candidatus Torokbacteria) CG_4_10_14_0_2_um_filter_35_8]
MPGENKGPETPSSEEGDNHRVEKPEAEDAQKEKDPTLKLAQLEISRCLDEISKGEIKKEEGINRIRERIEKIKEEFPESEINSQEVFSLVVANQLAYANYEKVELTIS